MTTGITPNNPHTDLLVAFRQHWELNSCWKAGDTFFLACSGGLDSVVLAHLLKLSSVPFSILHCNFQLRGAESLRDEAFVQELAGILQVDFKVKHFDTRQEMVNRKMGLQEVARLLRYNWFESEIQASGLKDSGKWLLTAHHADDQVETIAMNFFRGTGLAGMCGMTFRKGYIIRPLLFTDRESIRQFAERNGIGWVEDSSNSDIHYTRNLFRNNILPEIKQVFPQVNSNILLTAKHLTDVAMIYKKEIEKVMCKLLEMEGDKVLVAVNKLKKVEPLDTVLFELFSRFGFSAAQIPEVKKLLDAPTGKFILSSTHRLLKNRAWLIIHPIESSKQELIIIDSTDETTMLFDRHFSVSLPDQSASPDSIGSHAWLDAKAITFPLIIRPWKNGDYFYPLGMRKKKKVSRFMTDIKLSRQDKEMQWVVESDKRIIWVIGRRIDDRFKMTAQTQKVILLKWE